MSVVRGRASHSLPLRCGKAPDNQTVAAGHDLAEAMTFITFSEGWLLRDACRLAARLRTMRSTIALCKPSSLPSPVLMELLSSTGRLGPASLTWPVLSNGDAAIFAMTSNGFLSITRYNSDVLFTIERARQTLVAG